MKYKIVITKTALDELDNAVAYIAKNLDNSFAAEKLLEAAETGIGALADNPYINPLVHDSFLASNGIRFQLVNNYIAFYVVREDKKQITVLRFLHSRRNWAALLSDNMPDSEL